MNTKVESIKERIADFMDRNWEFVIGGVIGLGVAVLYRIGVAQGKDIGYAKGSCETMTKMLQIAAEQKASEDK